MNTIAPVKTRFKTLTAAQDHIENLERQVVVLNAELAASKTAAAAKIQTPTPPSAPAAANQPSAVATPPAAERSLAEMSKWELADAMDAANAQGDKATTDKLWREYSAR